MASKIRDKLVPQLHMPTRGIWGWFAFHILKYKNDVLEKNAARLCAIEPHHNVLEIGFGPGNGVKYALQYVKDGPGKICGVDLSPYMVEKTSARLRKPIRLGKVELSHGNVMDLPYSNNTFHRIFHCSSFYVWPSMQDSLQEITRVMKADGMMVTVVDLRSIEQAYAKGLLKHGKPDLLKYMCALELTGFRDVRIEYFDGRSVNYQAIFAHLPVKPAREEMLLELEEKELHSGLNDSSVNLNQKESEGSANMSQNVPSGPPR